MMILLCLMEIGLQATCPIILDCNFPAFAGQTRSSWSTRSSATFEMCGR
jgi:hypothetical protein